jgi:hypothetical protein
VSCRIEEGIETPGELVFIKMQAAIRPKGTPPSDSSAGVVETPRVLVEPRVLCCDRDSRHIDSSRLELANGNLCLLTCVENRNERPWLAYL